jgi:hypothetical protein
VLQKCNLKIRENLNFLLQYDKYLEFREVYSINRYLDHLITSDYSISPGFFDVIDLIFANAFSEAVLEYLESDNVVKIGKKILEKIMSLPNAILTLIPDETFTQDKSISIATHIYLEYPNVAVREFGIQFGFIMGKLGLEKIDSADVMSDSWYNDFREKTFFFINKKLKLFREE